MHDAPAHCPVCRDRLVITRLGCPSCHTELTGTFAPGLQLSDSERALATAVSDAGGDVATAAERLGLDQSQLVQHLAQLVLRLVPGSPAAAAHAVGGEPEGAGSDEPQASQSEGQSGEEPAAPQAEQQSGEAASELSPREQILKRVEDGQISPKVAAQLIANL